MDSNLARRIGFAAVAIPVALLVVWLGGASLVALVTVAALLGLRELFAFVRGAGVRPLEGFGYGSALLLPVLTYLALTIAPSIEDWALLGFGLWVIALISWGLFTRLPADRPLAASAATAFGVVYTVVLPSFLILLRHGADGEAGALRSWTGTWLVFFPLVVTWVVDTAAMAGGRAIGGPKLWPAVSPGKTRSGAVAGVAGGVAAAVLLDRLALAPLGVGLGAAVAAGLGATLAVMGQVGDLAESNFKREAGVKDSSALIPGHGGVLDRFDSLYFAVPIGAAAYRVAGVL
jgi:phosphatidate cytidylyltransferase